ncbi:MAG: hypothetical protein A2126_04145 [Candidatus Woykebacteria bacterium GWB1_45_5]|uniref:Uncharacterized protein n=2 Tax=Candidatus Woykeibacteriota TaxID=1817899 RepID=A0A1G1W278_9BACT|nr:MAG: hypothetical protein A2113_01950 [Candidatus Woykebacteria bacterium GWA1_44_8]OGY22335.1 MAG: hypothetical protein A2126_04145 [Candidatus Woykebacteria bacterium GWB1_45_5]
MSSGLRAAIAYSLPSYRLGFCGPQEAKSKKILLDFAAGKKVEEEQVKEVFRHFEAPYPYFKLIAKSNGIADPFDKRVVKAMWVGNKLLDSVKTDDLRDLIRTDFVKPSLLSREEAEKRARRIPDGVVPHHSFHVLILGAVSHTVELKGTMLDLCRVGWGRVKKVTPARIASQSDAGGSNKLQVTSKSLVLGKKIRLGVELEREISWNKDIIPKVKTGDWVSFHWAQACEVLTPQEVQDLEHYTQKTIDMVSEQSR